MLLIFTSIAFADFTPDGVFECTKNLELDNDITYDCVKRPISEAGTAPRALTNEEKGQGK